MNEFFHGPWFLAVAFKAKQIKDFICLNLFEVAFFLGVQEKYHDLLVVISGDRL